jgi:hypothetical protein
MQPATGASWYGPGTQTRQHRGEGVEERKNDSEGNEASALGTGAAAAGGHRRDVCGTEVLLAWIALGSDGPVLGFISQASLGSMGLLVCPLVETRLDTRGPNV